MVKRKEKKSEFMRTYLAMKYPVDHSHIQLKKGLIDFILGVMLGIAIGIIVF